MAANKRVQGLTTAAALAAGDLTIIGQGTNAFKVALSVLKDFIFTPAEVTKLAGIETAATADQTDAEVETAYNAQVGIVSQGDAEAGTATVAERWTPQRVSQAIAALSINEVTVQVFTADGTYTKPSDLLFAIIRVQAAGGGSGGCASTSGTTAAAAGGGGGGGYEEEVLAASAIGATETVTVGVGGLAATAGANTGGTGGTSSFGALLSATGGAGGVGSNGSAADVAGGDGGLGGLGSSGDLIAQDGNAGFGGASYGVVGVGKGGNGGSSVLGGGLTSAAQSGTTNGADGGEYGGGAAGSANGFSQSSTVGAAGGPGIIIVTEFKS